MLNRCFCYQRFNYLVNSILRVQVVRMEGGWTWPIKLFNYGLCQSGAEPPGSALRELLVVNNLYLRDIRCDNRRQIELAHVRVQSWALVSVVFSFLVHIPEIQLIRKQILGTQIVRKRRKWKGLRIVSSTELVLAMFKVTVLLT